MDLDRVNQLPPAEAKDMLLKCCGSTGWAQNLLSRRPFKNEEQLHRELVESWRAMSRQDWLEAFAAHPRIGDIDTLRKKYGATREWAKNEQGGVAGASETTLEELSELNDRYFEKFGYIFIVCATGKSAAEMLAILKARIDNSPEEELAIAADEQKKITLLRLEKL